jgi:hypothetical protein
MRGCSVVVAEQHPARPILYREPQKNHETKGGVCGGNIVVGGTGRRSPRHTN